MKKITFAFLITLLCFSSFSQIKNLVTADEITSDLHRSNLGKITFMNGNIPLTDYNKSDFLKTFLLTNRSDLNIRVFMSNSVTNYLHQLAPELSEEQLLKKGNLQFAFYVDGKFIYLENIHPGCSFGSGGTKSRSTTFRVPFTSTKGETWWAMNVWDRFKQNGGERALGMGRHNLKVEIRPYLKIEENGDPMVGGLIASGQLQLVLKPVKVSRKEIAVQSIAANSDWEISDYNYDKKTIEALNTKIANYSLKEITSIVVVHEGKLMLEEYFNGAERTTLHDVRSATKPFAATLIGIAINDGYIIDENQKLGTFYNLKSFENFELKKDSVTLKDLLTMSAAFEGSDANSESPGNEENMYPTDNWVKFALNLPMEKSRVNGKQWDYFTAGVVLLGDILDKKVPFGLEQYAAKKLFEPLGINTYKWQYTPQHVANTAGSLQMNSLDYAKYAQLHKDYGIWKGKQLLPREWVEKIFTRQLPIPERENEFYSYLFWNKTVLYAGKNYEIFYCAGNGGNQFVIFKDLPIVVIITSKAYNKPYGHAQADTIVTSILQSIIR